MATAERTLKRLLMPVTRPRVRRSLIETRDVAVGGLAGARGRIGQRMLPSFLVAGAQKAGTTYLHHELVRHPDVAAPLTKEVHFFDDHYSRGLTWYSGNFPLSAAGARQITGESSPGYLFHPWAPARIADDLPGVKVVVLLRDPVARAYSHFLHERRLGYEPLDRFEAALAAEEERTAADDRRIRDDPDFVSHARRHFSYRARGEYLPQLKRLQAALGESQVRVLLSERLFTDTRAVLAEVNSFLELRAWEPDRLGPNDMSSGAPRMDPGIRQELVEHFSPYNAALADHLGIDLGWST